VVTKNACAATPPESTESNFILDVDTATGQIDALGSDAIKVGFLYRPASVRPVGRTPVLATREFVNGGESGPRGRPSLAQAFRQPDGATVIVNVNHWKSKVNGCDVPDAGDGQGACNAARYGFGRQRGAVPSTTRSGIDPSDRAMTTQCVMPSDSV
jgi:uncharacterized protein